MKKANLRKVVAAALILGAAGFTYANSVQKIGVKTAKADSQYCFCNFWTHVCVDDVTGEYCSQITGGASCSAGNQICAHE